MKAVQTEFDEVDRPVPRVQLWVDEKDVKYTAYEIVANLKNNNPPIWVQEFSLHESIILLNPVCLADGEEKLIVEGFQNLWKLWNLI